MKIQWKYTEKASLLQAGSVKYFQIRIPNYFTERSAVYFNPISPARLPTVGRPRRVFLLYFHLFSNFHLIPYHISEFPPNNL
jgi:hypothetical protein